MSRVRVNYKSDLPPVAVKFKINGSVVDVPSHDFVIRFFVDGAPGTSFECAHKGDEYINCTKTADDTLTCYINNHKFGCGRLCCEFIDLSADSRYKDKVLKTVTPSALDVVLVEGAGDSNVEVLNIIFGYEINEIVSITAEESQEDGGTNVITITETNGEEFSFGVKNGHTGNGIASIETTESPESGGVNIVTIKETNGTKTEFNVLNGLNGVVLEGDPATYIADNLTTDDATKVLSAKQGKKLNDKISIQTTLTSAGLSQGAYVTNVAIGEPISPTINTSVQTYGCMLLPVSAGDAVTIATKGGSGARAYALTDSNYIALVVANSNVTTISNPVTLNVEQDGYLFVNCENTAFENFSIIHRASRIAKIEDDIENIDREVESIGQSLFGQYSYNNDYLRSGLYRTNVSIGATISTTINDVAGYGCMLLPVSAGDAVTISTKGADGGRAYALTDAEYRALVIAAKNLDTTSSPVTLNVEQDGYLFVNCAEEVYDDFSVHHKYSRLSEMEENIERVPGEAATNVINVLSDGNGKSQNFAIYNGHNCYISDLWLYDDGHSADTDIQRNVHTSSVGVFKDPIVSKVARYSGMATRRWKQYFNQEEGVGIGSAIGTLLSLQQQDSGEMLPLQMKATFYNPNSFPINVTLGLALRLSVGGYAYPSASKVTVPAEGSATAYFSYLFPEDSNLTWANVTTMMGYTTTDEVEDVPESDPVWLEMGDVDLWFEDPKHRVNRPFINPSLIENGITESQLTSSLQDKINATVNNTIDRNLRVSCAGSSVTWGDGFLQGSMMKFLIPMLQSQCANVIPYDRPRIAGSSSTLSGDSWRQLYGGYATKLEGANASLEFDIEGDELTICQAIERSNDNASVIDVYINGSLYGSFSNYNTDPIGHTTKTFTAEAGQKEFILEMPFTYNHVVTVNGVAVTANINTQGQGGTIPTGHWGMICRDVKDVNGETKVVHTLFAKEGQAAGTEISVSFDYGHEILYEKTTIGKDGNGTLESAFGRGYTAFDPAHPQDGTFESGLDFRSTDERAMVSYRFHESAVRHVKLVVKELDSRATDSEGTPYFIFNFATNRIMWFQNAGIGGYRSSYFISDNDRYKLKTWKEIADFQPDYVMYESAPNDDWSTAGYKLYSTYDNLTLSQLRKLRTLPNKEISYDSANDVYCYKRYAGIITAITKNTVTFEVNSEHVIVTAPEEGDVVQVGTYHSNNKEVVVRLVAAYDSSTHTITFDRPINKRDFIYDSLDDFVGLEIQVRDLGSYGRDTTTLCNLLKTHCDDVKIGLVCNPAPNLHCRNIDVYKPYLDKLANKIGGFYVDLSNVYEWQNSIPRDREETVSASSLETDPLTGYKTLVVDSLAALTDRHNWSVEVDGVNVYGTDAFVDTRGYGVSQSESGSSLNSTQVTGGGSEGNLKPRLIFVKNAPTTGTITLRYSSDSWSSDSTHLKNDFGRGLYAIGYKAAIMSNIAEWDNSSSGGGGGDIMVVRFRLEEGDTFSCDTRIADIAAAVSAGTEVVGLASDSTSQTLWALARVSVAASNVCVFDMQYGGLYTNLIGSVVNDTDVWQRNQYLNLVTDDQILRWNNKQDALVSGTNIKTINNQSLLGSGNITIQGGGGGMTETTWQELKDKRDAGELTPGSLYRITDYQCTTTQENTQSAGHQFDIVLLALSENKLAEEGWAMMHDNIYDVTFTGDDVTKKCYLYKIDEDDELVYYNIVDCETLIGQSYASDVVIDENNKTAETGFAYLDLQEENLTYNYFQNSNLSAWKVWYCLDNDKSRFAWADDKIRLKISVNGNVYITTGRVEGIDEGEYLYWGQQYENGGVAVYSKGTPKIGDSVYNWTGSPSSPTWMTLGVVEEIEITNGRGVIYRLIDEFNNDIKYDFKNIQFKRKLTNGQYDATNGTDTWCYTLNVWYNGMCQDASIVGNTLLNDDDYISGVYDNKFGYALAYNLDIDGVDGFAFALGNNVVLSYTSHDIYYGISSNTIKNHFYNNTIGNTFKENIIGNSFNNNTIKNHFQSNTIGNVFTYNTIGNAFQANMIGNMFVRKTIGDNVQRRNYGNIGVELATKDDIGNIETALNNI